MFRLPKLLRAIPLVFVVLLFCGLQSAGQICTGSLGDPVVNMTFGTGSNPGPPLRAQLPNLGYVSESCPDDGFYTIANANQASCFNGSWHNLNEDHTPGDVNGYMMVINASFNSGDFYVDTVDGLCGGTTYEFAAWVVDILRNTACGGGISPNLTFSVESTTGTVLGTYNTGEIPQTSFPEWKQYGFFFKTPATASRIVLRLRNNAPGGCGNDVAIDDITFRPCGPSIDSRFVNSTLTTLELCANTEGPVAMEGGVSTGYNNPVFQWQRSVDNGVSFTDIAGATGLTYTHQPQGAGSFRYRLAVAESGSMGIKTCRIVSKELIIRVNQLPPNGVSSNSPACSNDSIRLTATNNAASYSWSGPSNFNSSQRNPVIKASAVAAGKYYLNATDSFGCLRTDSLSIVVNAAPVAWAASPWTLCEGSKVRIFATGGAEYSWTPTDNLAGPNTSNPLLTAKDSTIYTVTVSNGGACIDTAKVVVNVLRNPKADAGPDKFISQGQSTVLQASVSGDDIRYTWSPVSYMNGANTLSPTVSPENDITYVLQVNSNIGCGVARDSVFVRVFKKVTVPNAFSPNGDGINDTWRIDGLFTYPEANITVFNRYGQLVYQSKGYNNPWDGTRSGKPLPVDTYYYIIDLKNSLPVLQGSVFIIR